MPSPQVISIPLSQIVPALHVQDDVFQSPEYDEVVEAIVASIKRIGWQADGLVVRKVGEPIWLVVDGHEALKAAHKLKMKTVECLALDGTAAECLQYRASRQRKRKADILVHLGIFYQAVMALHEEEEGMAEAIGVPEGAMPPRLFYAPSFRSGKPLHEGADLSLPYTLERLALFLGYVSDGDEPDDTAKATMGILEFWQEGKLRGGLARLKGMTPSYARKMVLRLRKIEKSKARIVKAKLAEAAHYVKEGKPELAATVKKKAEKLKKEGDEFIQDEADALLAHHEAGGGAIDITDWVPDEPEDDEPKGKSLEAKATDQADRLASTIRQNISLWTKRTGLLTSKLKAHPELLPKWEHMTKGLAEALADAAQVLPELTHALAEPAVPNPYEQEAVDPTSPFPDKPAPTSTPVASLAAKALKKQKAHRLARPCGTTPPPLRVARSRN